MLAIVHRNMKLADYAGPGHWNDPDMLEVGNGGMTATEYRSHFSLWSIMAAPLLIGTDLRRATADTMKILRNSEVIAVDQDRLGRQGRPLATGGGQDVLVKPMADGSVAVALFNETAAPARIATTAAAVGLERRASYRVRDLWRHTTRETSGSIAATVRAHGTVMYRVWSDSRADRYPPLVDAAVELAASRVARAGERVRVRTTATDHGRGAAYAVTTRLHAPRGWTVSPRGSARASLRSGDALRTRWTVAVPSAAKPGTYRLTAKVVYRTRRHGGRRVSVRRALDIQLGS
jgi:alpha-galactosidase